MNEEFLNGALTEESSPAPEEASSELSSAAEDTGGEGEPSVELKDPENQDTSRDLETEANALGEVGAIKDRERFIALRRMGLSLREATLLTSGGVKADTLSHLTGCVPGAARAPESAMTPFEFETARAIFDGLSDSEIHLLYKKVTR